MQRAMITWVFLCAAIPASGVFAVARGQQTTAQQAATATPPERIRIGGNVAVANLIHRVDPVYPPIAKKAQVAGTVVLHVIIGKDGSVQEVQVVSGPPLLIRAATDAVRQWRYKPTLLNGQPVEVDTTVTVIFALGGDQPSIPAKAEEVSLKDGTTIVGKVIAIDGDTFTIQMSFSKMDIPRSEILSISFSENQPEGETTAPVSTTVLKSVDQSISRTIYTNGTAHFTLNVPDGWKLNDALARRVPTAVGAVTASDPHEMILMETVSDTNNAEEEMQIIASTLKASFEGYEKLVESPVEIDGINGDSLSFRAIIPVGNVRTQAGTDEPANTTVKTPIKYLVVVLPEQSQTIILMCAAPEAIYDQFEPTFQKIVSSFHSTAAKVTPVAQPKQ